jgi:hypothetical protein
VVGLMKEREWSGPATAAQCRNDAGAVAVVVARARQRRISAKFNGPVGDRVRCSWRAYALRNPTIPVRFPPRAAREMQLDASG